MLPRLTSRVTILLCGLAAVAAAQPDDEIYLEITRPGMRRVAVAAPPLSVLAGAPSDVVETFQSTLDEDLDAAAPIAVVDERLYALVEEHPNPSVLHQRWRAIGAQFLLTGSVARAGGQVVVEARLIDLVSGEYAFAKRYRAGISSAKVVAHTLANDLVQVFTGRPGPFLSRIAFISNRTGDPELWVMDWNGDNPRQLTKHGSIALGPAWSPSGDRLVFTSYLRGNPALYVLTPQEGYLRPLYDAGGVNTSASFSPDGRSIAFASSIEGNVDIYKMSTEKEEPPTRLTTARGIDTQPSWSPNGRQIAFTSTRSGTPQIYLMEVDGTNVRRLSFGGGFHDEPSWSSDGLRVACTTKVNGRFQLATIDIVSGDRTVIPGPGNNESPSFSPDGSMLVFASDRGGVPQIYITDASGHPRQLTEKGSNYSPSWAPQGDKE